MYQAQRFSASTKIFGVIGKPISQSRGFLLYNAAMIEKGFDGVYLPFLVDDVELFFKTFTDFAGFRCVCVSFWLPFSLLLTVNNVPALLHLTSSGPLS